MGKIRVYLVEDETLVRQSLRALLEQDREIAVVGEAVEAETALREIRTVQADIVLMDIMLPQMNGIDATRHLRELFADLPIVILTSHQGEYVGAAIEAGARGYILKTSSSVQLVQAVKAAYQGQTPVDAAVTSRLVQELRELRKDHRQSLLKERQVEILGLAAQGMSYHQIGGTLFISTTTVKREMRDTFARLGVKNAAQAVSEALKRRLI